MVYRLQQLPLKNNRLSEGYTISLLYHDIFGYPLKTHELLKWAPGNALKLVKPRLRVLRVGDYYVFGGRESTVSERLEKEESSRKKIKLLSNIKRILESEKGILMVGITGSLAMAAAGESSDIDLLIITKKGRLWATRLKTIFNFKKLGVPTRRPGERLEQNKFCLNIWMDESDLKIGERNIYTAHELAQIVPLINKDNTYERLISCNKWILDYWPRAAELRDIKILSEKDTRVSEYPSILVSSVIEKLAYLLQRLYMSGKITREVVTPTRAFFHPNDWSRKVKEELERRGVVDIQAPS